MSDKNQKVFEVLKENGDLAAVPRGITHWIYPDDDDEKIPDELAEKIRSLGYQILDADIEALIFEREGVIDEDVIDAETEKLEAIALHYECRYDGWETEVMIGDA